MREINTLSWRLAPKSVLQYRCWENEYVFYNSRSGDTHLLDAVAAEILLQLQDGPKTAMSLASTFAPVWEVELGEEFVLQIEELLDELETTALIERIRF